MEPQPTNLRTAWADARHWRVPLLVLGLAAVVLTLEEYFFLSGGFAEKFPDLTRQYAPGVFYGSWRDAPAGTTAPWWGVFLPWAWWVGGTFLLWVLAPWLVARVLGFSARDLGLRVTGLAGKLWIYGALFLIVLIGVYWASTRDGFVEMYPLLQPQFCERWSWAILLIWWAMYAAQFFAVEFFFRGFMLFTLEKHFGLGAIAVMAVPYCMIHFHKPLPEALGAIVAGLVLGWLALKTRSLWGGVLLHTAVAVSMDVASLWQQGALPPMLWP